MKTLSIRYHLHLTKQQTRSKFRRVKAAGFLIACWQLGQGTNCLPYGRNRRIRGARTR